MKLVLVGAGGHARNVADTISACGDELVAYVDATPCDWLHVERLSSDAELERIASSVGVVLGVGGIKPSELENRCSLLRKVGKGRPMQPLVHPRAVVSKSAQLGDGCQIMAGVVVQSDCSIGFGAIVNTGAIVEHESRIAEGAHVAPGAVILGFASVGAFAMIGAGAIVLPGSHVPEKTLVKAGTVFRNG